MLPEQSDIGSFARSVYSQYGEDGILEEVFRRIGVGHGYFVEFGAWDGMHLSNAYNLACKGWSGVFTEGDSSRFTALRKNLAGKNVNLVNRYVALEGPDCLDAILANVDAPSDVDLLSIDIDSDDLAVFMSLRHTCPKCVVIEFNPTIPYDTEYLNKKGRRIGNSALSIKRHAESVGYGLIAMTHTNLVFLKNELIECAGISTIALDRRPDDIFCRYAFGYDGTFLRIDGRSNDDEPEVMAVPWHRYRMHQPIPHFMRGWDGGRAMPILEFLFSLGALAFFRPHAFAQELGHFLRRLHKQATR